MDITTNLYFRDFMDTQTEAKTYVLDALMNVTEKDSIFGKKIEPLRILGAKALEHYLPNLNKEGYDMMLAMNPQENEKIIGHIAFQEHEIGGIESGIKSWKVFTTYLQKEYRHAKDNPISLVKNLISHARENGIRAVEMGDSEGRTKYILNRTIGRQQDSLGIRLNTRSGIIEVFD